MLRSAIDVTIDSTIRSWTHYYSKFDNLSFWMKFEIIVQKIAMPKFI